MNAKEISRLVLYVAGGLLGLYLTYYGTVVDPAPETVAIGAALAGLGGVAGANVTQSGGIKHVYGDAEPVVEDLINADDEEPDIDDDDLYPSRRSIREAS